MKTLLTCAGALAIAVCLPGMAQAYSHHSWVGQDGHTYSETLFDSGVHSLGVVWYEGDTHYSYYCDSNGTESVSIYNAYDDSSKYSTEFVTDCYVKITGV